MVVKLNKFNKSWRKNRFFTWAGWKRLEFHNNAFEIVLGLEHYLPNIFHQVCSFTKQGESFWNCKKMVWRFDIKHIKIRNRYIDQKRNTKPWTLIRSGLEILGKRGQYYNSTIGDFLPVGIRVYEHCSNFPYFLQNNLTRINESYKEIWYSLIPSKAGNNLNPFKKYFFFNFNNKLRAFHYVFYFP